MNENETETTQEVADQQEQPEESTTVELVETTQFYESTTQSLDNLVNISLFSCVFLGAILGSLLINIFWKSLK